MSVDPSLAETIKDEFLKMHLHALFAPTEDHRRAYVIEELQIYVFNYLYMQISKDGSLFPFIFPSTPKKDLPTNVESIHPYDIAQPLGESYTLSAEKYLKAGFASTTAVKENNSNRNENGADEGNNSLYDNEESEEIIAVHDQESNHNNTSLSLESSARYNHAGRYCGRKFKLGEPIYRCQECGFDDTCVLCVHCFNSKDHEGHHVYVGICTGDGNGICDCGDQEAWPVHLQCKAFIDASNKHSKRQPEKDELEEFGSLFKTVLRVVLDYFIDVLNQNFESIPNFTFNIKSKLEKYTSQRDTAKTNELLNILSYKNKYIPKPDSLQDSPSNYTVMIYNDEFHNYSQATSALRQGEPDNSRTEYLTTLIDEEGRTMLKSAPELKQIIGGYFSVQTNGLSATLTSWTEFIHLETCSSVIKWIKDCLSIENPQFQTVFRDALCGVLCEQVGRAGFDDSEDVSLIIDKYFSDMFGNNTDTDPRFKYADLSVLGSKNKIPLGHHMRMDPNHLDSISMHVNPRIELPVVFYKNSRLQYLLFFENRYWKSMRTNVHDIVIPTLSSSNDYRLEFCKQFCEIFTHMINSVCYLDREPQLTSLKETVLQIFSCTTHANYAMKNHLFVDVIWAVNILFLNFSSIDDGALLWKRVSIINPSKGFSISFKQGFFAIETLLNKVTSSDDLLEAEVFISFVTLFQLFNGAYKIKRKEGEHVLREDQFFIPYMEYTISIFSIIQIFDKNIRSHFNEEKLYNAARLVYSYLINRTPIYKVTNDEFEIIKFRVSKQRVAYMNPVHTFFSYLIEHLPLKRVLDLVKTYQADFLMVADYNLRSIVLCSQIDIGFWVRNGISVLHQSTFYKKNPEISAYSRDIYMNQIAFLVTQDETSRTIYNMLDRWEILEWFNGNETPSQTVYGEKFVVLIQQFLAFVYHCISERFIFKKFDTNTEKDKHCLKDIITYCLFSKPLTYSKLLESIPEVLTDQATRIDECLNEVATYVPPAGLEDNGVFKLKIELYKTIDPLNLLSLGDDFENSTTVIQKNLYDAFKNDDKNKPNKETDIIIFPQLERGENLVEGAEHLASFTRTDAFSKVVYKLFHHSLENNESSFLYELLHLLHAIFMDDELVNGPASFPGAYIRKPVCNHLLSIILDSKISANIKAKSNHLLQIILEKNFEEAKDSLVSCFGEESFMSYYEKLTQKQNDSTEETDMEKKKRLAKKRHEKLMKKFKSKQTKFMNANKDIYDGSQDASKLDQSLSTGSESTSSDCLTCALCQEGHSENNTFVIPVYMSSCPSLRTPSVGGEEYARPWDGLRNSENNVQFYDYQVEKNKNRIKRCDSVFVSCNHAVHYKCIKKFWQQKKYKNVSFICPLCQTVCNNILPIVEIRESQRDGENKLNEFMNLEVHDNYLSLPKTELSNAEKNMLIHIADNQNNYDKFYFNGKKTNKYVPYILSVNLANTIAMVEVSSRLSTESRSNFLSGKEQSYKTMQYMLKAIVSLKDAVGYVQNFHLPYSHEIYNSSPNKIFQFVVREMIFTKTSLPNLLYTVIKQLFKSLPELVQNIDMKLVYNNSSKPGGDKYVPSEDYVKLFEINGSTAYQTVGFTIALKQLQFLLRKVLIFHKVVNIVMNSEISEYTLINGVDFAESKFTLDAELYCNVMIKVLTGADTLYDFMKVHKVCVHDQSITPKITISRSEVVHCSNDKCSIAEYELGKNLKGEYAGAVKLIDLSEHLNTYITDISSVKFNTSGLSPTELYSNERMDYEICLTCGVKLKYSSDDVYITHHSENCFPDYGLFFIPNLNQLSLYLKKPRCIVPMPAPYLNIHGETGKVAMRRGDLTTLSLERYDHINQLWLTVGIPGLISRILGDGFRILISEPSAGFANEFGTFRFNNILIDDNQEAHAVADADVESIVEDVVENMNDTVEMEDLGDRYLYFTELENDNDDGADEDDYFDDDDDEDDDDDDEGDGAVEEEGEEYDDNIGAEFEELDEFDADEDYDEEEDFDAEDLFYEEQPGQAHFSPERAQGTFAHMQAMRAYNDQYHAERENEEANGGNNPAGRHAPSGIANPALEAEMVRFFNTSPQPQNNGVATERNFAPASQENVVPDAQSNVPDHQPANHNSNANGFSAEFERNLRTLFNNNNNNINSVLEQGSTEEGNLLANTGRADVSQATAETNEGAHGEDTDDTFISIENDRPIDYETFAANQPWHQSVRFWNNFNNQP